MQRWIESAVWSLYAFTITLTATFVATGSLKTASYVAIACRIIKFVTYPAVTGYSRRLAVRLWPSPEPVKATQITAGPVDKAA